MTARRGAYPRAHQEQQGGQERGQDGQVKDRMKEAGGALTGDKSMKREGRSDQRKAKEKQGAAKDLLS